MQGFLLQFGKRLQELREEKGVLQCEVARVCRVSSSVICLIETGNHWPPHSLFLDICGMLGITPDDVFTGFRWKYTPCPTGSLKEGRGAA